MHTTSESSSDEDVSGNGSSSDEAPRHYDPNEKFEEWGSSPQPLNLLLLLHKHLKAQLMTMIVTVWMTSILLLMMMSVPSRSLLLHQHPKELEASNIQVAPVSPAVMKTIKSAGQNAVITMPIIMKAPSPNPKKMMPAAAAVVVMKRMMRLSISPNHSLMMPLAVVVVVVVVVMRTSLMSTLLSPCFIRIYFNDKQKIRLLYSLGKRRDPHFFFAQLKIESHDCKWKNLGDQQRKVMEDLSAATSDQGC